MKNNVFIIALFIFIALCGTSYAGISVCFDQAGEVTRFNLRGGPEAGCEYYSAGQTISDAQDSAIRALFKNNPQRYIKNQSGFPVLKSPAEQVAADDALAAQIQAEAQTNSRSEAKNSVDQLSPEGVRLRAALLVILDEMNTLRALHSLAPRTATQMKTAIKNKIDSGSAD